MWRSSGSMAGVDLGVSRPGEEEAAVRGGRRAAPLTGCRAGWMGAARRLASLWFLEADASWFPRLYELFFTANPWGRRLRAEEHRVIAAELQVLLGVGQQVLEVGSGTGDYTRLLHDAGARVSARDGSPAMVAYLRRRLRRERRDVDVQLAVLPEGLRGSAGGVDGAGVDGLVAIGVFNYNDLDECLVGCAGQVRTGGWLVFNVPSPVRAGWRYVALEGLLRRRVHLWAPDMVRAAACRAGLEVVRGPVPAGITDLYSCRRASTSPPG